jgi:hypothetical protein
VPSLDRGELFLWNIMMNFLSSKVRPNEEEEESKVEDTSVNGK